MNAAQQEALTRALRDALAGAGIVIERGVLDRSGNRTGWEEVPAEKIVYLLIAKFGWKVSLADVPTAKVLPFEVVR